MDRQADEPFFAFFTEIGIIAQLSRALFESRLPLGMTVPHFSVLNHLVRVRDGRTPLELARAFQVPKPSMTNTLSGLEARGLVEMRANETDARSKRVWLTERGRVFRQEAIATLRETTRPLQEQVGRDLVLEMLPRLSHVRAVLDGMREG